jgi:hypothetical protein
MSISIIEVSFSYHPNRLNPFGSLDNSPSQRQVSSVRRTREDWYAHWMQGTVTDSRAAYTVGERQNGVEGPLFKVVRGAAEMQLVWEHFSLASPPQRRRPRVD